MPCILNFTISKGREQSETEEKQSVLLAYFNIQLSKDEDVCGDGHP